MFGTFPTRQPDKGHAKRTTQYIYGTYINGDGTSKNVAISPVDMDKSVIRVDVFTAADADHGTMVPSFVDSATVNLTRTTASTDTIYYLITVDEYNNVKSKQTGSIAGASMWATVNINKVNVDRSILVSHILSTRELDDCEYYAKMHRLSNSNTAEFYAQTTYNTVYWQLLELA